ncbi:MAG TPA: nicotinate-nucleotide adenylyltransferase [Elusimicrobiota bacterium]|nr:nicotinate-nucleotide adenylyltransferase [Elusimicrobiota bacterium]
MKFGILGGTFDPVHRAHVALAEAALRELKLDRVFFVPAGRPPLKNAGSVSPARHRLALLRAALRGRPKFRILLWELRRSGVSYTHHTVAYLRKRYPAAEGYLLIGGDSLKNFTRWRRWTWLLRNIRVVVGRRPGVGLGGVPSNLRKRVIFLKKKLPAVSATEIRRRVRAGETLNGFVVPAVAGHVRRAGLYRR